MVVYRTSFCCIKFTILPPNFVVPLKLPASPRAQNEILKVFFANKWVVRALTHEDTPSLSGSS